MTAADPSTRSTAGETAGRVLVIACGMLAREVLAVKAQLKLDHLDLTCLPAEFVERARIAELRDHSAYGALAGFNTTALWQIIDDLLRAGELALDEHSRLVYIEAPAQQPASQ